MRRIVFLSVVVICSGNLSAQTAKDSSNTCLRVNALNQGVHFEDKSYFRRFGLLLRDTCSYFNRFSNSFYPFNNNNTSSKGYYDALLVDSTLASFIEKSLAGEISLRQNDGNSKQLKKPGDKLRKYIRLYNGFINDENDTCVVVQYLTPKEYNRNKFYSKQMDLIAQKGRPLRFVIFRKEAENASIEGCFPAAIFDN